MNLALPLKCCTVALISALAIRGQTPTFIGSAQPGRAYSVHIPIWSGGVLIDIENNKTAAPVIHSFDDSGREITPITFTIPDAKVIQIHGVARGQDGAYAVVGRAFDNEGREGGFVSWISPDLQTVKTTRTFPYLPQHVALAPDGTVWTAGPEVINGREVDPSNRNYGVIRQFDSAGNHLRSFIPRSSIFGRAFLDDPSGFLVSNQKRVGWYAMLAQSYFEVAYDGSVTAFPGFVPPSSHTMITGLALTDGDDVFASSWPVPVSSGPKRLYRLDRAARAWVEASPPAGSDGPPDGPYLYGGDNDRIVLRGPNRGLTFFRVDR